MNTKHVIALFIFLMLMPTCGTASAWLSGYDHRMAIPVNNTGDNLTYYQYNFTVDTLSLVSAGKMNANGSDCRITNSTDVLQEFWNETAFNNTSTKIWVNGTLLGNITNTTHYMYYGESGATPTYSISNTMLKGDDFAGYTSESWTKYAGNPVMNYGTGWESVNILDPWIKYNISGDGIYHMWYGGYDGTNALIGYANSTDGITWVKYAGNPIITAGSAGSYDDTHACKPTVEYKDGIYHMLYSAQKSGGNRTLAYATSSTNPWGTFTKNATNPVMDCTESWEEDFLDCPSIMWEDSMWKVWYAAGRIGALDEPEGWGYANGTDLTSLTKYASNPIASPLGTGGFNSKGLGGLCVKKVDGIYHNYYNGFDNSDVSRGGHTSSYTETDWTLSVDDLILDLGSGGTWDDQRVYRLNMEVIDGTKTIWYNADDSTHERIGQANYTGTTLKLNNETWKYFAKGTTDFSFHDGWFEINQTTADPSTRHAFIGTKNYNIPNDVWIETKFKWTSNNSGGAQTPQLQLAYIGDSDDIPYASNSQFLFSEIGASPYYTKHQSRNAGSWGSEDNVYTTPLVLDTVYKIKLKKLSGGIDWYLLDSSNNIIGSLEGNTDAPTGISFPLRMGARFAGIQFDHAFVRKYTATEPTSSLGAEESAPGNQLIAIANQYLKFNDWNSDQTFSQIGALNPNDVCYSWYNHTSGFHEGYYVGRTYNEDKIVPKNCSVFGFFDAQTTISATVNSGGVTIQNTTWFDGYLPGHTAKTLTEIETEMDADGLDVWSLYGFSNATQAYTNTGSYSVAPNEGYAVYVNNTGEYTP